MKHKEDNPTLRQIFLHLPAQFCALARPIIITTLVCLLGLAGALTISMLENIPAADLTRDPLQTMHARFYIGLISNIGILLWMSAAVSSSCCAALLRTAQDNKEKALFYFLTGALSFLLTLDDLLMIHEKIWPFITGLSSWIIVGIYGILFLTFALRFYRYLISKYLPLLLLSLLFLGLSETIDFFCTQTNGVVFFEDSLKLFGIAFWALYFSRLSVDEMRQCTLLCR